MYSFFLVLHSWLRWVVVVFALLVVLRALLGLVRKSPWSPLDDRLGRLLTMFVDVQLIAGFVLYVFLSPTVKRVMTDFAGAMGDKHLRFWGMEHVALMVLGAVLVHVGRVAIRRTERDVSKHRRALIWFGIALLLTLAAIPWPMLEVGRPLFRPFLG